MTRILVTGAFGLVGTDLVHALEQRYAPGSVVALARKTQREGLTVEQGDVTDIDTLSKIIQKHDIKEVYHLAGLISVGSEKDPQLAWRVNLGGLKNILDLAVQYKLRVFWPSSIAVFGPTTPRVNTPQHTILEPTTIYGVTKTTGELLCQYYHLRYGVDVRSLRYPGLIAHSAPPGDGTTEYSVHIFYGAIQHHRYEVYLRDDTRMPMMYMDDAIRATLELMDAPGDKLTVRTSYNLSAINFTPSELASEIQKHIPLQVTYAPDHRQRIADSWPESIDDSTARSDWGWRHEYDLSRLTETMLVELRKKLAIPT